MENNIMVTLNLEDGTPDGIIEASLEDWNGRAFKIPRSAVKEYNALELECAGIYFLFGNGERNPWTVYIGQSDNVLKRVKQHLNEKKKWDWHTAIIVKRPGLNSTLTEYLEHHAVQIAKSNGFYKVETKSTRNKVIDPRLTGSMNTFLENMRILINILGYKVLNSAISECEITNQESKKFYLNIKDSSATGVFVNGKFLLLRGSSYNVDARRGVLPKKIKELRKNYGKSKVKDGKTIVDISFDSPRDAGSFVMGYPINSKLQWKNEDGKTLKELESGNPHGYKMFVK
ncbi:GIY-YIG nuclease family protein [Veillonella ratti]|uniref:GIY-YIG nuclease family protein n=1 Tax=Veillonella ratti TaxID=103892 RepID=UPI000F8E1643|nr:GIY-YIG nuclease family protein [Veillonella ratti]